MPHSFCYRPDGRFRILQLTDLHYQDGSGKDRKMLSLVRSLIEWERPDLVMLTGDVFTNDQNVACVGKALHPVSVSKVPFAFVFGNHDTEYGAPHKEILSALGEVPGFVNPRSAAGIPGYSNFTLTLGEPDRPPEWLLIGLDSHAYNAKDGVGGYDFVKPSQITWYRQRIRERRKLGGDFGALCFLHIPLPEYAQAYIHGKVIGRRLEEECCARQNSGFFSAMLDEGDTCGVFAGHDHINDYCAAMHGIALCYGRAGGYSTYGRRGYAKGSRVIELNRGVTDKFDSWIRLVDGSIHNKFSSSELME